MINYGYFRHRFDAHLNPKLNNLVDQIGLEAYAYYYTLLEVYGAKIAMQDDKESVTLHIRILANVWRKRIDSCRKVLTLLELSDLLVITKLELSDHLDATNSNSTLTIRIPNFLKYYGSYKKTETDNTSNKRKEKEIKEKKSKVNESKEFIGDKSPPNESPLAFLFEDQEIKKWLRTGTIKLQDKLLSKYAHETLRVEIDTAYIWQCENKKMKAGLFLVNWFKKFDEMNSESKQARDRRLLEILNTEIPNEVSDEF
jgi:hypothetical protein